MSSRVTVPAQVRSAVRVPKTFALAVILLLAGAFVFHYVFPYYLHYNPAEFEEFGRAGDGCWRTSAPEWWLC
jgi:hypothetical protein